jgi:undecaprenyl-diphosphatase
MSWWQAILLGLVEGITEYLPVSSSAHLLVTQRLLGIPTDEASNAYAICIQAGAIAAVLGLYRQRVTRVIGGVVGRDPAGRNLALQLVVAFLPAAVIGKLFDDTIERVLFGVWPIVTAWAVGGVLLLVFSGRKHDSPRRPLEALSLTHAFWIGLAQCLAMWPGTSRSLVTIVAGLLVGLSMTAALEFAFLLGVLTLGAATAYKTLGHGGDMVRAYGLFNLSLGFFVAWASAAVAVQWMVGWLERRGLALFGYWRLLAAAGVAALALSGVLSA